MNVFSDDALCEERTEMKSVLHSCFCLVDFGHSWSRDICVPGAQNQS